MRLGPSIRPVVIATAITCASNAAAAPARISAGGAQIEVTIPADGLALSRPELMAWIARSADAVIAYYGRFPVPRFRIEIKPAAGRSGVVTGTTWAYGGAHARIVVGEHATADDLARDWIMVHEMIHTAFPDQPEDYSWIEEGISTYVEPLARSWAGGYPADRVWLELIQRLPQGLPAAGDRGLDHTHTWGRTYWGGALFCLLADVEIRERTNGQRGLVDALRGILAAGGNDQVDWSIERAFREGDKATGVPVLQELYRRMKDAPVSPDLGALWRSLGVRVREGALVIDERAPRAAIRRAISRRPGAATR